MVVGPRDASRLRRIRRCRASLVGLSSVFVALTAVPARADAPGEGDGVYGRLDGDTSFVVGVDAGVAGGRRIVGGDLRLRYLDAAGLALGYEEGDALARATDAGALRRAFRAGIELRPLFPARFLKDKETGTRFVDLVLDSFAVDLAAIWAVREATTANRPGLLVGLAAELPLFGQANGMWLRVAPSLRWSAQRIDGESDPGGRIFAITIGLAWHQFLESHIADRKDRRLR